MFMEKAFFTSWELRVLSFGFRVSCFEFCVMGWVVCVASSVYRVLCFLFLVSCFELGQRVQSHP